MNNKKNKLFIITANFLVNQSIEKDVQQKISRNSPE